MGKIKLNLVSGANVEKPLVTAFKVNDKQYVVLDNEMTGSMGLPIILVCKLENNKLVKIVDPEEWTNAKEYLKQIIAGNKMDYMNIGNDLFADDIYYTQLTLPIQSFDILKNSYKVEDSLVQPVQPNIEETPTPFTSTPPMEPMSSEYIQPSVAPEIVTPPVDTPTIEQPITIEPSIIEPTPAIAPEPTPAVAPELPDIPMVNSEDKYQEEKEAFMQACENMFNALVQKFEKDKR